MTNEELADYYANTLILQYRNKTNAYASVYAMSKLVGILELCNSVLLGYDKDTAVGAQLDILGKYLGVARAVVGAIYFTKDYFWLMLYTDTPPIAGRVGFLKYSDTVPENTLFRSYAEDSISTYTLTDSEMRFAFNFAIIRNYSDGSMKTYDQLLYDIFGSTVYYNETAEMEITMYVPYAVEKAAQIARSEGYLSAPQGVKLILSYY